MAPKLSPKPGKLTTDPDLNRPPPTKLVDVDWSKVDVSSEAAALALWKKIDPNGDDWEAKLDEVPEDGPVASALAVALLHEGNFTCVKPVAVTDCAHPPLDEPDPEPSMTLADPCLRRMLAMWAIGSLDEADLPAVHDSLKAIAAIPPPESQLVATALDVYPEHEQAPRLELRAIAFAAGNRDLVNGKLSTLDESSLVDAATKSHIDGALDLMDAETNRAVFLAAVTDAQMAPKARVQAMSELATAPSAEGQKKLAADLHKALLTAWRGKDCAVAAGAARILVQHGEAKFGPSRPHAGKVAPMMRALCVLASYERMQEADEPSYLLGFVPPKGLEVVRVDYDPYNDDDADGDGDPHTIRLTTLVPRTEVTLPELEDMIRAFDNCTLASCKSAEHEFRFGFRPGGGGELQLARIEVIERPPCPTQ